VNVIAILRWLAVDGNAPASMSQIARALNMNQSTCYNTLKTLAAGRLLTYEPSRRAYELGLALPELAAAVDESSQVFGVASTHLRKLAHEVGLTSVMFRYDEPSDHFVAVDKVDSASKVKVTVSIGEHFPPDSAVLSKAYFAWQPPAAVEAMVAKFGLFPHTANAITNPTRFRRELVAVRRQGFSTSYGEYYPGHNAVGAASFDRRGGIPYVLVITGFEHEIHRDEVPAFGRLVLGAARAATAEMGGGYPELER
jgi:DNA-binding IclR family transcriptional regulator